MQDNLAPERSYDYLIIGAGPAGLQLAYDLESNSRSYAILESGSTAGTFFQTYPRHDRLLSINKIHTGHDDPELNMRWDWNSLLTDDLSVQFSDHTDEYLPFKSDMTAYLEKFAEVGNLNIIYNAEIVKVSKDDQFQLTTANGDVYTSKVLIAATGIAVPNVPDIPGIELAENYISVSVDPKDFTNQRVLIIGKGNSAFETSDNLIPTAALIHVISRSPVQMAWKSNYVGHLRAINNVTLETYRLKSQNAVLDGNVLDISKVNGVYSVKVAYSHANDEIEELFYDRVIICTGFKIDDSFYDESAKPELMIDDRFPALTSEWESVNVPGLYFAGTLMQSRDFRKTQSAFIHGFRYNVRMLASVLEAKHESVALPFTRKSMADDELTKHIIERVNRVSAHWQQPGYFCDLMVVQPGQGAIDYYQDLTVDYVDDVLSSNLDEYMTVTLEFGQEIIDASPDIFAIERPHKDDIANAHLSTGIHPIVRFYSGGNHVSTHHVIEDFASEWKEEVHVAPLQSYLQQTLSPKGTNGSNGTRSETTQQSDAVYSGGD